MNKSLTRGEVLNSLMISNMNENVLYNWLFHFNHHTGLWYAFHREDHAAYWNGSDSKHPIIKSRKVSVLMEILQQTNGDPNLFKSA